MVSSTELEKAGEEASLGRDFRHANWRYNRIPDPDTYESFKYRFEAE